VKDTGPGAPLAGLEFKFKHLVQVCVPVINLAAGWMRQRLIIPAK
jgi:hypothetical protein